LPIIFAGQGRSKGDLQPLTEPLRSGVTAAGPAETLDGMEGCDETDIADRHGDQSPEWQKRPSEPAPWTEEPVGTRRV
jgi:hypothetical protein